MERDELGRRVGLAPRALVWAAGSPSFVLWLREPWVGARVTPRGEAQG